LEESLRADPVRPHARLDARPDSALEPAGDARDRQDEHEHDDGTEQEHRQRRDELVGDPGERSALPRELQDQTLHRSISGATRSKLATTAMRSASINPRL